MNRSIEDQLLNPRPGSACARARDFGIDLTLLVRQLKMTPTERLEELQQVMIELDTMRTRKTRK
jgi:hypothetical protein